mmetsp:Transcript_11741/g.36467  ORF Transcript_11741/g.36467 Transcript_11741/m.36467 type:complete len:270 (+) Transcript_11741:1091-1900(+)
MPSSAAKFAAQSATQRVGSVPRQERRRPRAAATKVRRRASPAAHPLTSRSPWRRITRSAPSAAAWRCSTSASWSCRLSSTRPAGKSASSTKKSKCVTTHRTRWRCPSPPAASAASLASRQRRHPCEPTTAAQRWRLITCRRPRHTRRRCRGLTSWRSSNAFGRGSTAPTPRSSIACARTRSGSWRISTKKRGRTTTSWPRRKESSTSSASCSSGPRRRRASCRSKPTRSPRSRRNSTRFVGASTARPPSGSETRQSSARTPPRPRRCSG